MSNRSSRLWMTRFHRLEYYPKSLNVFIFIKLLGFFFCFCVSLCFWVCMQCLVISIKISRKKNGYNDSQRTLHQLTKQINRIAVQKRFARSHTRMHAIRIVLLLFALYFVLGNRCLCIARLSVSVCDWKCVCVFFNKSNQKKSNKVNESVCLCVCQMFWKKEDKTMERGLETNAILILYFSIWNLRCDRKTFEIMI